MGGRDPRAVPHGPQGAQAVVQLRHRALRGIGQMAYSALKLFGETAEAQEGITAFNEKRAPEFAAYRTH